MLPSLGSSWPPAPLTSQTVSPADLGEAAVAALANGLKINDTLVSIDLIGSTKVNDCALNLAAALRVNQPLFHVVVLFIQEESQDCGAWRPGRLWSISVFLKPLYYSIVALVSTFNVESI